MTNFAIGLSGLRSSQYAMEVISNNIANADSEGYHRRSVHLEETLPGQFGGFQFGTGVSINYIERVRDSVTESSLTFAISDVSRVDQTLDVETQLESLFHAGEGSMIERVDAFFAELTKLTSTPGEPTQRNAVLEQADQLSQLFHQISGQMTNLRSSIRYQVEQEIDTLNGKMQTLTDLNVQISSQTVTANHELDQLDQLINEIATIVDVARNERVSTGATLAFGGSVIQQGFNPSLFHSFTTEEGDLAVAVGDSEKALDFEGGRMPALLDAYNNIIPEFEAKLNELASGLIQQMDQIHAVGVGPSGSFNLLEGNRPVEDPTVPLAEAGAAFPIEAGDLYISIIDADGNRRTETVSIDPETDSLEDIAATISGFSNINASVNAQTNGLQIVTTPGYQFDFTGNLETTPNLDTYAGSSVPTFSGSYTGDVSQSLSYQISGTGEVGVSSDLLVNVFNEDGAQIARLDIGEDYEAGTDLEIFDGVSISFPPGSVVDGDSFESELVDNPDETGILSALGMNSFFEGEDASTIAVNAKILADKGTFASGVSSDLADTTNLLLMIDLQQTRGMANNSLSFGEYLNEVTTTIGIRVSNNTQLSSSLNGLQTKYEQERDSVSGVDLNEELVYMQQFQKQHEASIRVIQTAEAMFDQLFQILQ
jgi:flagellar hook-associated protein FlgK